MAQHKIIFALIITVSNRSKQYWSPFLSLGTQYSEHSDSFSYDLAFCRAWKWVSSHCTTAWADLEFSQVAVIQLWLFLKYQNISIPVDKQLLSWASSKLAYYPNRSSKTPKPPYHQEIRAVAQRSPMSCFGAMPVSVLIGGSAHRNQ